MSKTLTDIKKILPNSAVNQYEVKYKPLTHHQLKDNSELLKMKLLLCDVLEHKIMHHACVPIKISLTQQPAERSKASKVLTAYRQVIPTLLFYN